MRKIYLLLFLANLAVFSWAQRTPEHPLDIPQGSTDLYTILASWEPGTPPPGTNQFDDQFYISRVRPLPRIVDGDYQVNSSLDKNRKLCVWVPMDDPTTTWKALPRYCFEGDNFSMWSYTDIHGNWTAPWMRVTAGITDVAHKNGVKVGCVNSIPFGVSVSDSQWNTNGKVFYRLFEKNTDGTFKYSMKLVKLMKYYGIDGLGCNSEFISNSTFMSKLMAFSQDCHKKAKEIGWEFQLHWYDGTDDNGSISFDKGLASHNDGMFGTGDNIVTDMMFANYNWYGSLLTNSVTKAESMGRSSYDYYAGFDIQGRAFKTNNWSALKDNKISIGLWGAHAQSLLHQSATDDGSSDIAIQKAYLLKQELAFSGGNRNPGLTPPLRTDATLANADLKTFHGLASLLTAKSTLQQLPFVTRFSLGNGLFFNNQGKTTFAHKWYNINTQDFLPTWRWWITNRNDQVTQESLSGLVKADFTFDDAWFGGSCLKLHGATDFSRVKLFKTNFDVKSDYTLSLTYKVLSGTNAHAKMFVALKGALSDYKEIALPAAAKAGEWTTFTSKLSELGLSADAVVSMIGLTVEGTTEEYSMLLGEMSLKNPSQTFATVQPEISKVEILRGRYNQLDFKLFYKSKDESNGVKTYNDEVDTWYYEIYFQQKGEAQQLLTATTSWAGYVIDAPLTMGEREGRFGVRAVSPDGKNGSEIRWTEYQALPYNAPSEVIELDRPVIKPNEVFTASFKDLLHANAKWEIKNPFTGASLASAENVRELKATIADIGLYDLYVTNADNKTTIIRGFIQITPEQTGAVPRIQSLGANKTTATANENVEFSYTSRDGEGTVSRALKVADPQMFMVPADAQTGYAYSYALWFKADKFSHDKQGTNLINKNSIADDWPHNNWGDLWVTIRPQWQGTTLHPANEVSFNTMGWTAHDSPNESMMSTGFNITPGVWNHLVITEDANKNQKMYLNGKKVAETLFSASTRREDMDDKRINKSASANIFFGGGGVYKAGFNGAIDEVQIWNKALSDDEVMQSMKGYEVAPEGLTAYYTFEEKAEDNTFANKGKGGDLKGSVVIVDGSGGEATNTASYKACEADNGQLGYPGIIGTLEIKTTPEWRLQEVTLPSKTEGKAVTVSYTKGGKFNAGLTIANMWGKDTRDMIEYITITSNVGIEDATTIGLSVYPNPFIESVNMMFPEGGNYTIRVVNALGQVVTSRSLSAAVSEIVNVAIDGPKGLYYVQILKDKVTYKTVKVIKK